MNNPENETADVVDRIQLRTDDLLQGIGLSLRKGEALPPDSDTVGTKDLRDLPVLPRVRADEREVGQ